MWTPGGTVMGISAPNADGVMAGLVPATHDFPVMTPRKSWVAGPSPAMTPGVSPAMTQGVSPAMTRLPAAPESRP
jgi:hypothetical protein